MIIFVLFLAAFVISVIALARSQMRDSTWWVWSLVLLAVLLMRVGGLDRLL